MNAATGWPHWLAISAIVFVIGGVYLATMLPGVGDTDAAEMQYKAPLLGICHPPGYSYQVLVAWAFSKLPLGGDPAWRINLLLVVCGVLGALALYGAVRRITGQIFPALLAAALLAFSSVYWSHALIAEVYVFYGMLLLAAVYCAVRFAQSDRAPWLFLMAAALGVMLANRPSEVFVLPGFLLLWPAFYRRVRLNWRRLALVVALVAAPYAGAVAYHLLRDDPRALHAIDDTIRDELVGEDTPPDLPFSRRLALAVDYTTGMKWIREAAQRERDVAWNLDKYAWMISGLGGLRDRFPPDDPSVAIKRITQGVGSSVTMLGVAIALFGCVVGRKQWGWVALGGLMFLGNGLFYLYHAQPDNLDFTIPSIIGLCLLFGIGAAWRPEPLWLRWLYLTVCSAAPIFLLATNYSRLDYSTPEEAQRQERLAAAARIEFPQKSVVVARYPIAMTYRYLYRIASPRGEDVQVIINRHRFTPDQQRVLMAGLKQRGYDIYLPSESVAGQTRAALRQITPPDIAAAGLLKLP